jgi:hypothetical protein
MTAPDEHLQLRWRVACETDSVRWLAEQQRLQDAAVERAWRREAQLRTELGELERVVDGLELRLRRRAKSLEQHRPLPRGQWRRRWSIALA